VVQMEGVHIGVRVLVQNDWEEIVNSVRSHKGVRV
jgi:hypothetical protein